jgi:hypothetical protein
VLISTLGLIESHVRLEVVGISVILATSACGSGAVQPPLTVPSSPMPPPSAPTLRPPPLTGHW